MNLKPLATIATAAALALPSQAGAQWANVSALISPTHDKRLVRLQAGTANSYSWIDATGPRYAQLEDLFGQSQWWLGKKINDNVTLTAGAEYEAFTGGEGNLTPQVGANVALGQFNGSVRVGGNAINAEKEYLSIFGSIPVGKTNLTAWYDLTRDGGRIGEGIVTRPIGKGWTATAIIHDYPYTEGRYSLSVGVQRDLPFTK